MLDDGELVMLKKFANNTVVMLKPTYNVQGTRFKPNSCS